MTLFSDKMKLSVPWFSIYPKSCLSSVTGTVVNETHPKTSPSLSLKASRIANVSGLHTSAVTSCKYPWQTLGMGETVITHKVRGKPLRGKPQACQIADDLSLQYGVSEFVCTY